jgi:hypothetical protein
MGFCNIYSNHKPFSAYIRTNFRTYIQTFNTEKVIIGAEMSKVIIKSLTSDLDDYSSDIDNMVLYYRKIDIGDRYCYDVIYDGDPVPLIGFRIDLDPQDINININILDKFRYGYIRHFHGSRLFNYSIALDIIQKHRGLRLGNLLK